jgi:alpha-beta hydrolase superfamily lysophospholipase
LSTYLDYQPVVEPEDFDICPVLLTQPAADRWTPLHLAEPFLAKITQVPVTRVMLEDGGHYPIEQSALDQMVAAIADFCAARA